jgi:hypothetical protein
LRAYIGERSPGTAGLNPAPVLIMHTEQTKPPLTDSDIDHLLGKVTRQSRRKQILRQRFQAPGLWGNLLVSVGGPVLGAGLILLPDFSHMSDMKMLILVIGVFAISNFIALFWMQRRLDAAIELLRLHDAAISDAERGADSASAPDLSSIGLTNKF